MRNIYQLMRRCESDRDEFGDLYPDLMTLPINRFKYTIAPDEYYLTEADVIRFDLLIYAVYGISDYDDIVLWLNNISFKEDLVAGTKIILPNIVDISKFYIKYLV